MRIFYGRERRQQIPSFKLQASGEEDEDEDEDEEEDEDERKQQAQVAEAS
jgi:hypothetical protein